MKYTKALAIVEYVALIVSLCFGLAIAVDGHFNTASYYPPVFDNSMLWAARARIIGDTGHYPEMEVVFGGITKTYHVPFWPGLVAGFSALSGLGLYWTIRAISFIQVVLLGLGVYLLAKRISGSRAAGALAAFLAFISPNLMMWGTRTSPISWGVVLLPFGLWFALENRRVLTALVGMALALDHQPTLVAYLLTLLLYVIFSNLHKVKGIISNKSIEGIEQAPIISGVLSFATYMTWHIRQTGLTCLNFKCLPQSAAHEFGNSIPMRDFLSKVPSIIGAAGVLAVTVWAVRKESRVHQYAAYLGIVVTGVGAFLDIPAMLFLGLFLLLYGVSRKREELMLLAFITATAILVKNDALGIGVFTDRFLTHFDLALAVAGGVIVGIATKALGGKDDD